MASKKKSVRTSGSLIKLVGIPALSAALLLLALAVPAGAAQSSHTTISQSTLRNLVAKHPPIPNKPVQGPKTSAKGLIPVDYSGNWSGYVATPKASGVKSFTYAAANVTVPSVNCSVTPTAFAYQWVGLDGWTDGTVEQDGVGDYCVNGSPTYFAWSEMYPAGVDVQFYLNPGDAVQESVNFVNGEYELSVTDVTSGQTFSVADTCASTCSNSSAEVINEGYPSGSYTGTADFGQVHFDTIIIGSKKKLGGLVNSTEWKTIQVDCLGGSGYIDTEPGPVATTTGTPAQSAFEDTWLHVN